MLYYANESPNEAYLGSVKDYEGADVYIRKNVDIDGDEQAKEPKLIAPPILTQCTATLEFLIP